MTSREPRLSSSTMFAGLAGDPFSAAPAHSSARTRELEGCIGDLLALFALPSLWDTREPAAAVDIFLDVLFRLLPLELAYVRVLPSALSEAIESFRGSHGRGAVMSATEVGDLLRQQVPPGEQRVATEPSPPHSRPLLVARYSLGVGFDAGEVILASRRARFPTSAERMIARTAANQLVAHLAQARLLVATQLASGATERRLRGLVEHSEALASALRADLRQKEEAYSRQDVALAAVGHELRNALAPVQAALRLSPGDADRPWVRQRAVIERHVGHLDRMVEDLLDLTRIAQGKMIIRQAWVDVREVVARAIEVARPLLEQKRHRLALHAPAEPLPVDGDEVRLCQVVVNLLTNAAKYTEPGGEITVSAGRETGRIVVRVKDTGPGLSPELLPRVFEKFVQGSPSNPQGPGGLGLGLAIVRCLVERHGGEVEATNNRGPGSEFIVRLPTSAAPAPVPVLPPSGSLRAVQSRRVLVVDDNRDAAETAAEALTEAGHNVRCAFDGATALLLADDFNPEVILLDIGLPGMDGYEVAARVRQAPAHRSARLVALTGHDGQRDRMRVRAAGFSRHLVKPVDLDRLLEVVAGEDPGASR